MKQIFILFILLTSNLLPAQEIPKFIQDRIDFCDLNFTEELTAQLRKELNVLEDYFVKKGLLTDKTGSGYSAVYAQIAKENNLNFVMDTNFELLDTVDIEVSANCFYKLLTADQLSQLGERHQEAAERITERYDGDITPGIVAQRILDNLTVDDFNLEFYRISSLLTFYRIASPGPGLNSGLPDFTIDTDSGIKTIKVFLNNKNDIEINGKTSTLTESKRIIYKFISFKPQTRGIEFAASRSASYETYMEVTKMLDSVYSSLQNELGDIPKNIVFKEPE